MGRWLVAIGVLVASTAAADAAEWGITPPAGWEEDAVAAAEARDEIKAEASEIQEVEVGVWSEAATGATLGVHWYRLALDSNGLAQVDAFDRGVLRGVSKASGSTASAAAGDRGSRVIGSMAIRETTIDQFQGNPVHMRLVRRYQPAADGLHVLIMTCASISDLAACNAAIDAVRFQVPHPVPLDDGVSDAARQFGQVSGKVLVFCALGVVVWAFLRKRKRPQPPVTAAGPPGSPPGSGGAADGR